MNFWYMQLHPGKDPNGYPPERMLAVVRRWRDVGMGDESQWRTGGIGTRRRFREVMQTGDIIALGHGKRLFALVRVTGAARRNEQWTDDHWYMLCRPVEIIDDCPIQCEQSFAVEHGKAAADGLPIRQTLALLKKNQFVAYWYRKVGTGETLSTRNVLERQPMSLLSLTHSWRRDSAVARQALSVSKCERCGKTKTFHKANGRQYFEAHHLVPMAMQASFAVNLDVPANVVCLCPECHRLMHHGREDEVKASLRSFFAARKDCLLTEGIARSQSRFVDVALCQRAVGSGTTT